MEVPLDYPVCLNRQCPQASTCLRQIAEQQISDNAKYWTIISPKHLASFTGDCPYYRHNAKVVYAQGCIGILEELTKRQLQNATSFLVNKFNKRTYYRMRKGERLLSPSEQQAILDILKECGVTNIKPFDKYIEGFEWQ